MPVILSKRRKAKGERRKKKEKAKAKAAPNNTAAAWYVA
jgi:hypothetical protein